MTPASQRVSPDELAARARAAVEELAASADPAAFAHLLELSRVLGESLGRSARNLAEAGSWAEVAGHAGTTRQAAWARWSEH